MINKRILAFGASNSRRSINKQFAKFAADQVSDAAVQLLDLNDFEMPIFSVDRERESGIPDLGHQFKEHIKQADGIIISFAEHNGAYTTAFKNIYDWISRIERDVWASKPMFVLAAAPGGRGGQAVQEMALIRIRRSNSNTIASFSLPLFRENFSKEAGITNPDLLVAFREQLELFEGAL